MERKSLNVFNVLLRIMGHNLIKLLEQNFFLEALFRVLLTSSTHRSLLGTPLSVFITPSPISDMKSFGDVRMDFFAKELSLFRQTMNHMKKYFHNCYAFQEKVCEVYGCKHLNVDASDFICIVLMCYMLSCQNLS